MIGRLLSIGAAILLVLAFSVTGFAEDSKLAFFDMNKFMAKSTKAKELQKKFTDFLEVKKSALEKMQKEITAMKQDLQSKSSMLKEDKLKKDFADIKKAEVDFELAQKDAQNSVQNEEREFMAIIQRDITKIIGQIRTQKKLALVFNSVAMVSADDAYDITEEVVKAYDASPDTAKAPKPKAPTAGIKHKPDTKK